MTLRITLLAAALCLLSACGMQRAVGVLPSTLDDLQQRSAEARGEAQSPRL